MDESNDIHCSHTIAGHAGAAAVVAQDRMDPLADRLGSVVLAPIRASEFSFLLRSRKCVDRNRLVVGESADFVLGGLGLACVPDDLPRGPCKCLTDRTPPCRRPGIHVRSRVAPYHSPAQFVSHRDPPFALICNLASGL